MSLQPGLGLACRGPERLLIKAETRALEGLRAKPHWAGFRAVSTALLRGQVGFLGHAAPHPWQTDAGRQPGRLTHVHSDPCPVPA